jgi:hypothetical protein
MGRWSRKVHGIELIQNSLQRVFSFLLRWTLNTWIKTMERIARKTPQEQADLIAHFKTRCPCGGCPTYTGCTSGAREKLFCVVGRSFMCISQDKGCICPTCPIGRDGA